MSVLPTVLRESGDTNRDGVVLVVFGFLGYVCHESCHHVVDGCFVATAVAGYGYLNFLRSVFVDGKFVAFSDIEDDSSRLGHTDAGGDIFIKK